MDPLWRMDVDREGATAVVRVAGELDSAGSRLLRTCLGGLASDGVRVLRVDVGGVSFVDAAGLGVLIGAARRMREVGGELVVESPSRSVTRLLALTGADAALGLAV
jgi:anti-sigma B factor antagonist